MRVLVLGGTGAMGHHLSTMLADRGDEVFITSRQLAHHAVDRQTYLTGNAKDMRFLRPLLDNKWDAIVDFMYWTSSEFSRIVEELTASTSQYIFLSSYRVYADAPVITESSPRLLDVVDDKGYLSTNEYALEKARCEDLLTVYGHDRWTVVRPAITYDGIVGRLQLGPLELSEWCWRACQGIPVPLPEDILNRQTTMTWGSDVATIITLLIDNPAAIGETYTASTSEHCSWLDVSDYYRSILPLTIVPCDTERFCKIHGGEYQIRYDRMYNRIIDNSKVINATGFRQEDFKTMRDGIECELQKYLKLNSAICIPGVNAKLDMIMGGVPSLGKMLHEARATAPITLGKYAFRRAII